MMQSFLLPPSIARFLLENGGDCVILSKFRRTGGTRHESAPSTIPPLISPPRQRRARSISMNGSATAGLSFSPIRRNLLPSAPRNSAPWPASSRSSASARQDHRHFGRPGRKSHQVEERHQGRDRLRGRLPADRRPRSEGGKALRTCCRPAPERRPRAGRLRITPPCVRSTSSPRQEDQADPHLSDGPPAATSTRSCAAIDSIQLTAKHQVATPANWQQGEDVIITAAVSNEDAVQRFGSFDTVLPYLRKTKQPTA